jgi:hypothetical protein
MEVLFWLALAGVAYAYFGYPLLLLIWGRIAPRPVRKDSALPTVSVILPVHNEAANLGRRLENLLELDYPEERIEIFIVSDGSTDATLEVANGFAQRDRRFRVIEVRERGGKGNALNAGLKEASNEIVVFTDAGISLEGGALRSLVAPFSDARVGCVSGEDWIAGGGGEALYGRYELFLRNRESLVGSLVGASGSFYGQRRELCPSFPEGIAPDFLSVLHVVDQGFRAVSEPAARGTMRAVRAHGDEFRRKVRTLLRGMTGLFAYTRLLNPARSGSFALLLFSHKLMRWLVPFFLGLLIVTNTALLDQTIYQFFAIVHFGFYLIGSAALGGVPWVRDTLPGRVAAYFINVNAAIVAAWWRYSRGGRQEIWNPSAR